MNANLGALPRGRIDSVQIGRVAPLGSAGVPSGFVKDPVAGSVAVHLTGLEGDEQADLTVHGGRDKAVYAYPVEHYPAWRDAFPHQAELLRNGALGENLTISGFTESDVCIGDVFAVEGGVRLQVTQPRQPCFKFALRFDEPRMPQAMVMSGRCGWYFRVLAEGKVASGPELSIVERPNPDWTVTRFHELTTSGRRRITVADVIALSKLEGLADVWQARSAHSLGTP